MIGRVVAPALLLLPLLAGSAAAQRLAPAFPTASVPSLSMRWSPASDTQPRIKPPPTYWLEAGVAGAVLVGVLGWELGRGWCGYSDQPHGSCTVAAIKGAVIGASLGLAVGSLIGGQFPKHPKPT